MFSDLSVFASLDKITSLNSSTSPDSNLRKQPDGVVFGALTVDGRVDVQFAKEFVLMAKRYGFKGEFCFFVLPFYTISDICHRCCDY